MNKLLRNSEVSHQLLALFLQEGQTVVDATAGNGFDTLFLAKEVGASGRVYAFDIQEKALVMTKTLLSENNCLTQVKLIHDGHENIKKYIKDKIQAAVFNLGYLPGGDKNLRTKLDSTLGCLRDSMELLQPGGVIAITLYCGHPGGEQEASQVEKFLREQQSPQWQVLKWQKINGTSTVPYLIFLYKGMY